ncbi:MAG: ribonuclease P protein component [Roseobacter sp.]
MTPSQAPQSGPKAAEEPSAAASLRLTTLTKRADFLRASRGPRVVTHGFVLQVRVRQPGEACGARVGFTCSKKVGNAVARNRAKRRLREIARLVLPQMGHNGVDYVLIGRAGKTASHPFGALQSDLRDALRKMHKDTG